MEEYWVKIERQSGVAAEDGYDCAFAGFLYMIPTAAKIARSHII